MSTIKGATYTIAHAAGWDAGNKHAREHGRKVWNEDDAHAAAITMNRILDSGIGIASAADIESSRQPTTIRKTRELTQARIIKSAIKVGALASVLGVSAIAQQLDLVVRSEMTVSTSLPDAPSLDDGSAERVSQNEYLDSRIQPIHQREFTLPKHAREKDIFLTPLMVGFIAGDVIARGADAIGTRANLTNPCQCYVEENTPHQSATSRGQWTYSMGVVAENVAASYLIHRLGRHFHNRVIADKLDVIPLGFDIVYDAPAAVHNFKIAGVR